VDIHIFVDVNVFVLFNVKAVYGGDYHDVVVVICVVNTPIETNISALRPIRSDSACLFGVIKRLKIE